MKGKSSLKDIHVAVFGWHDHLLARQRRPPKNIHQSMVVEYILRSESSPLAEAYAQIWAKQLQYLTGAESKAIDSITVDSDVRRPRSPAAPLWLESVRFFESEKLPAHIQNTLPDSLRTTVKTRWLTNSVTITGVDPSAVFDFPAATAQRYRIAILDPIPFDLTKVIDPWKKSVSADVYIAAYRGGDLTFSDTHKNTWLVTSQFELEGGGHSGPIVDWADFAAQLAALRARLPACLGLAVYSSSAGVAVSPPETTEFQVYVWQHARPHQAPWHSPGEHTPGSVRLWVAALARHILRANSKAGFDAKWCRGFSNDGLVDARIRQSVGLQLPEGSRRLEFPGELISASRDEALRLWEKDIVHVVAPPADIDIMRKGTVQELTSQWRSRVDKADWNWHSLKYNDAVIADTRESASLQIVANQIAAYMQRPEGDPPLSLLVLGQPGSGKSYIVRQVAISVVEDPKYLEFLNVNIAQLASETEMQAVFERARSARLSGKQPVVFLDEYDCERGSEPLGWLRTLLGPMQDGSYWTALGERPLGKCIFVFAGGVLTRRELEQLGYSHNAAGARLFTGASSARALDADILRRAKVPDFLSRIRLIHDVPDFEEWTVIKQKLQHGSVSDDERSVLLRCATHSLRRRAILIDSILRSKWKHLDSVEPQVLEALLDGTYRHGVRSLEAIIVACDLKNKDQLVRARLPPRSLIQQHCIGDLLV